MPNQSRSSVTSPGRSASLTLSSVLLFLCFTLGERDVPAQAESGPGAAGSTRLSPLDAAKKKLAANDISTYDGQVLAQANDAEAIPALEKQFASESDPFSKSLFAQSLVRLHDSNPLYWDYLASQANSVLNDNLPTYLDLDSKTADKDPPVVSAELVQWAAEHRMSVEEAQDKSAFSDPGILLALGGTRDPRAIPFLQRALTARNYFLHAVATTGLVLLDDPASVPLLLAAFQKDPPAVARVSADKLAWSSSPEAQHAAAAYLTKEQIEEIKKSKAAGKTFADFWNPLPSQP